MKLTDGTRVWEAAVWVVGRTLNRHEILAALGTGGMGEVGGARDTRLGHEVAL